MSMPEFQIGLWPKVDDGSVEEAIGEHILMRKAVRRQCPPYRVAMQERALVIARAATNALRVHSHTAGPQRHTMDSFLYIVGSGAFLKIGRSRNPHQRFSIIQCSTPTELEILSVTPEYVFSERRAHEVWSKLRTRGEWFLDNGEIREWIKTDLQPWATRQVRGTREQR